MNKYPYYPYYCGVLGMVRKANSIEEYESFIQDEIKAAKYGVAGAFILISIMAYFI